MNISKYNIDITKVNINIIEMKMKYQPAGVRRCHLALWLGVFGNVRPGLINGTTSCLVATAWA